MINILSPQFLENMPQPLVDLYQELETFVITDIARRLKKAGEVTSTAEWQKQQAELFSINNINQKVTEILKKSNKEIEKMFNEAALTTMSSENETFKKAGYKTIELNKSKALQDYLKTAIKQTKGDIENITQSMGFAEKQGNKIVYNSVAKFYQKELNLTHMKVSSGVQDYNTAIKQAVNKIASSGVRTIDYENGYSINVDSAARRAVLTSVHQFNQETINHMSSEIIENEDNRYYEVTAHAGARTGIGINNHAGWQGKVYKFVGSDKDYPNLKESTGLGDMLGLMGINCKHSYFAFIPGVSVRTYTDEQLKNIDPPPFNYKDKEYTHYEATQYQRQLENEIRKTKRELIIYKETGLENEFKNSSVKLKNLNTEYKNFSEAAGISQKKNRTQTTGFSKGISQKATLANKEIEKEADKMYNTGNTQDNVKAYLKDKPLRDKIKSNEVNKNLDIGQYKKHVPSYNKYKNYAKAYADRNEYGPSVLTISKEEAQELINKYAGTGILGKDKNGNWSKIEIITNHDSKVGIVIDNRNNNQAETNVFKIKYGNKGAHIVPDYPSKKGAKAKK